MYRHLLTNSKPAEVVTQFPPVRVSPYDPRQTKLPGGFRPDGWIAPRAPVVKTQQALALW
jgi:hypothetical protein